MKQERELLLLPAVKDMRTQGASHDVELPVFTELPDDLAGLRKVISESFGAYFTTEVHSRGNCFVKFTRDPNLPEEGYALTVEDDITVRYSQKKGALYALMTLRQLLMGNNLPGCRITDEPALRVRGFMLDVSRGKIPESDELKKLVDLLVSFKYNHLQLYFEGMPFAYPGYEEYALPCAYTPREIAELDAYCGERCIELVPNFNTLGHMSPWLTLPRFRRLAEKEEGLSLFGMNAPPTTLDCENPDSLKFVLSLADGLLPCFGSRYVNVGLDEPFELGKGKNAAKAETHGASRLYFDYVKRLYNAMRERDKTMMMWGDIVSRDFDTARALPEDVVLLEWGYQAEYPFDAHAAKLHSLGKRFLLCPGTSSWLSVGGITDNMTENVTNAAAAACKHGATGMILTDWGDGGHIQCREISYPAMLLFAALAWNPKSPHTEKQLCNALDNYVFFDGAHMLGSLLFDLGRYCQYEEVSLDCRTVATLPLLFPEVHGNACGKLLEGLVGLTLEMISPDLKEIYREKMRVRKTPDLAAFDAYAENLSSRLCAARPQCADGGHVIALLKNTLSILCALTHAWERLKNDADDAVLAAQIRQDAETLRSLWTVRNRMCGGEDCAAKLLKLADRLEGKI